MGFSKKKKFTLDHSLDDFDEPVRKDTDISTISGRSSISNPPSYVEDPTEMFETPEEKKLRKRSHWIAYATMFVMTVGFSVVLSGVWPYLEQLEGEGTRTKAALGWVVAANPFGQMLASPVVGYIGNRIGSIRRVCYFTVTCFIFGNFLYAFLPAFNNPYGWMIFSRFIVGISSSNVTLCRSYLASSTTTKERTKGIAIISAAQSLGFVVGPAIQTVLSLTVPDEYKYRSAGWVAAGLGFINLIILNPKFFQEYNISQKERDMLKAVGKSEGMDDIKLPSVDKVAIVSVLIAFFMNQFIYVLLETLMEPFTTDQYEWCHDIAVVVVGVTFMCAGFVAVAMFITATRLAKIYDERKILIIGALIPICIGLLIFQPLPFAEDLSYCPENTTIITTTTMVPTPPIIKSLDYFGTRISHHSGPAPLFRIPIDIISQKDEYDMPVDRYNIPVNRYDMSDSRYKELNSLVNIDQWRYGNYKEERTLSRSSRSSKKSSKEWCDQDECYGCSYDQEWCIDYPRLPLPQFYIAFIIVVAAYPYGVAMSNAIFSKIIGPKPQGTWMGVLTSSGSLARVTGPIFVSYVYTKLGTRWCFGALFVGTVLSLMQLLYFFPRLIPMKVPVKGNKSKERV